MTKNDKNLSNLKKQIINFMEESNQKSYYVNDLSNGIGYTSSEQFKEVVKALASLERDRQVLLTKDGQFKLLEPDPTFIGKFSATDRGFGFVNIPDFEKDIFIGPRDTGSALNGDTVRVEITKAEEPWNDHAAEGRITEIIERELTSLVGEFQAYPDDEVDELNLYGCVNPNDRKMNDKLLQIVNEGIRPVDGQIVLVEITQYPRYQNEDLMGIVTKIIGHRNDPGIDILTIAYKHGINPEFPPEVLAETAEVSQEINSDEIAGRKDLRAEKIVTIDGADAKDLDDAVNVHKLANGNYHLGVHIADVSHYIKEGTALDEEAFERGTSSYLIDRVIPMLPPELSNGICSLHPNVDRLTLTCDMEINQQGKVVKHEIYPSVIKSYQRMTYTAVNQILMDEDPEVMAQYSDLVDMFREMEELHNILEQKRTNNGAISFDSNEIEFKVDAEGTPLEIGISERGVGERIIESFMLTANETVSEHYAKRNLPILYRVHESPDESKMQRFIEFARGLGIEVKGKKDKISPKVLQGILDEVKGEPTEAVVNMLMLRSMQQAHYDVTALGHYGLASEYYSHFTSPIRRYPDLILHRLIHYYQEVGTSKRDKNAWNEKLPEIAEHSSMAERRAVDAEREVESLKMAEYMQDKVGLEFEGLIVSITNFGMFVQVEDAIEGLVHLSTMKDDYYEFSERGMILIGQRTGKIFRIGEKVTVELTNVDIEQYDIDFVLVEDATGKKSNGKKTKDHKKAKNSKKSNGKKNKNHKKSRNVDFKIRDKKNKPKKGNKKNKRKKKNNK